ncbi:hypothetical protein Tco_1272368 [Tanacetum coccineum]
MGVCGCGYNLNHTLFDSQKRHIKDELHFNAVRVLSLTLNFLHPDEDNGGDFLNGEVLLLTLVLDKDLGLRMVLLQSLQLFCYLQLVFHSVLLLELLERSNFSVRNVATVRRFLSLSCVVDVVSVRMSPENSKAAPKEARSEKQDGGNKTVEAITSTLVQNGTRTWLSLSE